LLLAHSDLEGRTVSEPVSLSDLFDLFVNGTEELLTSGGRKVPGLLPFEDVTASQYPATGGEKFFERHPNVDPETIRHRIEYHSAVVYDETWKIIAESTGERWAGDGEGEQSMDDTPTQLVEAAEEHLAALQRLGTEEDLSEEDVSQLEALGYL
jgi:hypothetical protein